MVKREFEREGDIFVQPTSPIARGNRNDYRVDRYVCALIFAVDSDSSHI